MKEFDFDELDRAVNSLMSKPGVAGTPAPKPADDAVLHLPDTAAAKPVVLSPGLNTPRPVQVSSQSQPTEVVVAPTDSQLAQTQSDPAEPTIPTSTPIVAVPVSQQAQPDVAPSASVIPRKNGRFMDVVHPSSDMRAPSRSAATTRPAEPSRPSPRIGTTIAPPTALAAPTVEAQSEVTPEPVTESPLSAPVEQLASALPDPIEHQVDTSSTLDTDTVSAAPAPTETVLSPALDEPSSSLHADIASLLNEYADEPAQPATDVQSEPTQPAAPAETTPEPTGASPFIPGTKVEKRPLGSGAVTPNSLPRELTPETTQSEPMADPVEVNAPVSTVSEPSTELAHPPQHDISQPEFDAKLLAIESSESVAAPAEDHQPTDVLPISESQPAASEAPANQTAPNAVTSIAPQYKVRSSSDKQQHTPIYDTHTQALKHPAKKKSSALIIVGIIMLILLGAGGAVALFYFNYL